MFGFLRRAVQRAALKRVVASAGSADTVINLLKDEDIRATVAKELAERITLPGRFTPAGRQTLFLEIVGYVLDSLIARVEPTGTAE